MTELVKQKIENIIVWKEIEKENYSIKNARITGIQEREDEYLCQVELYYFGTVAYIKTTVKVNKKELEKELYC